MAIEEHQAGKPGVQRLNYLYILLKTTTAYDTGNRPLAYSKYCKPSTVASSIGMLEKTLEHQ